MKSMFKKVSLGTALVVTVASALMATPAAAQGWRGGDRHGGNGAGVAIAAGVIGLAVGAALADQGPSYGDAEPIGYAPYGGPAGCYQGYPGYDDTCYPVADYYRMGWSWRDGSWWGRDGQRYARPFMGRGGPMNGGYPGGGMRGGDMRGGFDGGHGYGGGRGGQGFNGGGHGSGGGDHGGGGRR